jgi:hypothetical protein
MTATANKMHTESTDRTPVLATAKTGSVNQWKTPVARFGSAARPLLTTLMRSLANPHI